MSTLHDSEQADFSDAVHAEGQFPSASAVTPSVPSYDGHFELVLEPGRAERNYWGDLFRYRELFIILAWRDIAVRYKQTVFGVAWAVVRPFITMVIFTIIFGRVAGLPSDGAAPYAIMVLAGMLPWTLFSTALGEASGSLVSSANLISKVYFPRLIVPAAAVITAFVDMLISLGLLAVVMAWYRFAPGWQILFLPVFALLALLASLGPGLYITALNVKYRDFRYVIPFLVQFGLYVSPVGFSSTVIPAEWRLLYSLNPMVGVIDGFRWCILAGDSPLDLRTFSTSLAVVGFFLWLGTRKFRSMERSFADIIERSMSDVIIQCEGLGKSYLIGHEGPRESYTSLRDVMAQKARGIWNATRRAFQGQTSVAGDQVEEFWALRDVSFEVKQGEVVGIIGRNGAGKSTLLKILSRITEPTTGRATLRGRVASLLEVGTGFHPELTGRENIYLNGAILGMSRAEIKRKFDEIVAFAEIAKFLDTPVKRYSSGMYVRLAFAVAAHLDPEILIVDEVLAVGDAEFQKKCLGKMRDVSSGGRTVLFVSHSISAIQSLCSSGVLLQHGKIAARGETNCVVSRYLSSFRAIGEVAKLDRVSRQGDGSIRLTSLEVLNADSEATIKSSSRLKIRLGYEAPIPITGIKVMIGIYDERDTCIYGLDSELVDDLPALFPSTGFMNCITAPVNLTAGHCSLNVAILHNGAMADYLPGVADFSIEPDDFFATGRMLDRRWTRGLLKQSWNVEERT